MIKAIIKFLASALGHLLSCLNSYHLKMIRYWIYTARRKGEFRHFGSDSQLVPHFRNIVGAKYISIGDRSYIGSLVTLAAWDSVGTQHFSPSISLGNDSCIGDFSHISCINRIEIGNNVLMGKGITITDNSHGNPALFDVECDTPPVKRPLFSKGPVIIADNVWLCDKCTILAGVSIGYGAIIAANAVVTHDVPPLTIVAGNPARIIRTLNHTDNSDVNSDANSISQ